MKDQTEYTPYYHGRESGKDKGYDKDKGQEGEKGYDKDKDDDKDKGYEKEKGYVPPPPPPPPPPHCPDPCDERPPWGPPDIRPECCPNDRECCPEEYHYCTWYEVEDPCIRASSCVSPWTKVECNCKSSNEECDCEEWDCSSYPQGTCVPCYPCEGLLPNGPEDGEEPTGEGCAADLRKQLNDLRKAITSQQTQKADIEAKIGVATQRAEQLQILVNEFNKYITNYGDKRQALICKEDCLKGFYRDTARTIEQKFPHECLEGFRNAINLELCKFEQARCCKKNLEEKLGQDADGKPTKFTELIWDQQQAEKTLAKAQKALNDLTTFDAWLEGQFGELDKLIAPIEAALKHADPLEQRLGFYLFYWKFVPQLCKRFPIAICCPTYPGSEKQYQSGEQSTTTNIGCEPGDWHPSVVTVERLTELICCAVENVRAANDDLQAKKNEVEKTKANLKFINEKIKADETTLEDLIKTQLKKVECKPTTTYR